MNLRFHLYTLLLCTGLILSSVPVQPAAAATVLKIATVSPDGTTWMRLMRAGAKEIAQRTGDRVQFKFYPGGIMGNDESVLRKIRIGQLHGGAVTGGSLIGLYPDNQLYGMPFLFRSLEEVSYVRQRMDPQLIQGLQAQGLISFGFAEGGFAYLMSAAPVRTLAELRAQKVWVPPMDELSIDAIKRASISPIPLQLPDVLTALQTGLINTVTTSPIAAIALQWHTKVRYLTQTPLSYFFATLVVDAKAFNKVSPADQQIVREVMGKAFVEIDATNRADNASAMAALAQQGIEFVQFEPDSLEAIRGFAAAVRDDVQKNGRFQPDLVNSLQSHIRDFRATRSASNN